MWFALLVLSLVAAAIHVRVRPTGSRAGSSELVLVYLLAGYCGIAQIVLGDQAYGGYPASFAWFGQGYMSDVSWWPALPGFEVRAADDAQLVRVGADPLLKDQPTSQRLAEIAAERVALAARGDD